MFLKIIENTKDRKFKVNSEMMNLLGCSKENFYKLMVNMIYKKDIETIAITTKAKGTKCPICWKINEGPCPRHSK